MASPTLTARGSLLLALIKGPAYGLELLRRLETLTDGRIKLQQAALYPALRKLESEKLLCSWEGEPLPERGGRPRRFYQLTAKGKKVAMGEHRALANLLNDSIDNTVQGDLAHV